MGLLEGLAKAEVVDVNRGDCDDSLKCFLLLIEVVEVCLDPFDGLVDALVLVELEFEFGCSNSIVILGFL